MTVPAYLRPGLPEGAVEETLPVWRRLLTRATRRVVISSPFLDAGFAQLVPALGRLTANGCDVLLITRALRDWRDGEANREAVQRLREACAHPRLDVVSWNEEGLGLHLRSTRPPPMSAAPTSRGVEWVVTPNSALNSPGHPCWYWKRYSTR